MPALRVGDAARAGRLLVAWRSGAVATGFGYYAGWHGVGNAAPQIRCLGGGQGSMGLALGHGISHGYSVLFRNSQDASDLGHRYRELPFIGVIEVDA